MIRKVLRLFVVAAACTIIFGCTSAVQKDVPYVPTSEPVVRRMLELGEVTAADIVYDLGSGDGRIPIAAVRDFGAKRAVGIEIDPELVALANENARIANVSDRVQFVQADIFEADFSEATVITLYLWPKVNLRLRPRLFELKPGTRVVSHSHNMGDWRPEKTVSVDGSTLYFWRVPERPAL